ncbi:MAG: MFS transporter [Burkholderiales bacterium]|nr:MFS transporter [Burkholderiales bacterium]
MPRATPPNPSLRSRRWWREPVAVVVAGGAVMGLSLGVRYVQGLFQLPVVTGRGWTRETFAFAMAIQNLAWGVAQPFTGMVADRFGSARVIATGLVLYALGLAGMASATTPAAFTWAAGACIGVALSCTAFGTVYGALNRLLPPERRSWAMGLAGALGGFGQFALVPLVQGLIGGRGWIVAVLVLAVACLALLPLALPLREEAPAAAGAAAPSPDLRTALREAFGHRGFWLLNLGFTACGFQLAFIATHLPAYLRDKGLRPGDAVAALAIIALANVAGTYVFGLLGARLRRKNVLAGIYLLRSAAMALFLLLPLGPLTLFTFAAVMGFIWLGTLPLTNGIVGQVFGVRHIGSLFGFVFFGHQFGSFLGVWLGGLMFVRTQSYDLVWLLAMALGVLAAALHWPIDDRALVRMPPRARGVA